MNLFRSSAVGLLGLLFPLISFALNGLSIDLKTFPAQPVSGQTLTYQVEWRAGTGSPCRGDVVLNLPASGVTFQSSNPGGSYDSGNNRVVWSGVYLHNNSGSRWARVTVDPGVSDISATAAITGGCSASTGTGSQPVDPGAVPILELTKTASKTTADAGEQVIYTLHYANTGAGPATNVVLTDDLPAQVDFVTASNMGSEVGGTVTWNLGTLAAGTRGSVTATVNVDNPIADGTVLQNFARIVSTELPTPLEVGPIEITATSEPVLTVSKATANTHVDAGQQFSYQITYGNAGTDTATGVVVQDALPTGVTFVSASAGGTESNGVVTWNLPDLPAGRANVLLLTVQAPSPAANGTVLSNDTTVDSNETGPLAATTVDVTVDSGPVLTLTKDVSKTTADAGDTLTWTLTYSNTGSDAATNVQLQDVLPAETTFVSATNQGIASGQQVDWNIGTLAAGASGSVIVSAAINTPIADGVVLHNTASVQSAEVTQPATAFANTTVSSAPRLAIEKTVSRKLAQAGESIVYTINYSNTGTDDATNVTIEDHLPAELSVTSISGNGSETNGIVTWDKGTLAAGAKGSVTITATIDSPIANGTILHNAVTIDSTETAPVAAAVEPADVFVVSEARLTIDLDVSKTQASPGETLVYQVTYGNSGTDAASDAQVVLGLPPNVILSSASAGSTTSGNGLVWNVGLLGAGATGTLSATVTIESPLSDGTKLHATANISDVLNHFASDTVDTVIDSAPRLELTKTASKSIASPGDTLVYNLAYRNSGTDAATDVLLEDVLPPDVTFLSATGNGAETGGKVDWDLGTVAAGTGGSVSVRVTVNSPLANGTVLHNHATIDSTETAAVSVGPVDVTVSSAPRLTIDKKPSRTTAQPGYSVTWTITYANTGTDDATGVSVEDHLPADVTFTQASNQGAHTNGVVDWNLGTVAAGSSGSLTVAGTVKSPLANGTVLHNSASIDSVETKPVSTGPIDITVDSKPALSLLKKASVSTVKPGDTLVYTLEFSNSGTDQATGVVLEDHLPPEVTFVQASNNGIHSNGVVEWDIGTLGVGASSSVTVQVSVKSPLPNGTILHNSASLHSNEVSDVTPPVTDVTVSSAPTLTISKTASKPVASPDDTLIYTIDYANTGTDQATDVLLEDHLPPEVSFISASKGGIETGGVVEWDLGTLPAGSSGSANVTVSVNSPLANGTVLHNTATIDSNEAGPSTTPPADVTVSSAPRLTIAKTASRSTASPGDEITYTITYGNAGTDAATNVVIEDILPANTTFVSASTPGTESGGIVDWNIGNLAAGATGSVSLKVSVNSPLTNGTLLHNSASIASDETTPLGTPNVDVTVSSAPVLTIRKSASASRISAGSQLTYTLDYSNSGSDTATGVVIEDQIPSQVTFLSASSNGSHANGVVSWDVPDLPAGSSGSVNVTVTVDSPLANGTILHNNANVDSAETAPVSTPFDVTVSSAPALQLTASLTSTVVSAGGQYALTLQYANIGNENASGVEINAVIPPESNVASVTDGGSVSGGTVSWTIPSLAAGTSGSVSVTLNASSPLPNGLVLPHASSIFATGVPPLATSLVSVTILSTPAFELTKTPSAAIVGAGREVTYDITYFNNGSDQATGVLLRDAVPANTSFVSASAGGAESGGVVTWNVGTVPARTGATVSFTLVVDTPLPDGTQIGNQAEITSNEAPPLAASANVTVSSAPQLVLIKTSQPASAVEAGGQVNYRLTISNPGSDSANGVSVVDRLPAAASSVMAGQGGQYDAAAQLISWGVPSLAAGASLDLDYSLAVPLDTPDGSTWANTASAQAQNAAPATAGASLTISSSPKLELTKTGGSSVDGGQNLTYTITYVNSGNATAQDVVIQDVIPAGLIFVSASTPGAESGGTVTWALGDVPPGGNGAVTLTLQAPAGPADGTVYVNTASIAASNAAGASGGATTVSRTHVELDVSIAASPATVAAGSVVEWAVSYANIGNADAQNPILTATLPANTTFVDATSGGVLSGNEIRWSLASLPALGSGSVTFRVQVDSPLPNNTTASSTATIGADNGQSDSATDSISVSSSPLIVFTKTSDRDTASVGTVIEYGINVSNAGNATATGVVVTDAMPPELEILSASAGGLIDADANSVTWTLGDLAPGNTPLVLSVQAQLIAYAPVVTNVARISTDQSPDFETSLAVSYSAAPPPPVPGLRPFAMAILIAFLALVGMRRLVANGNTRRSSGG